MSKDTRMIRIAPSIKADLKALGDANGISLEKMGNMAIAYFLANQPEALIDMLSRTVPVFDNPGDNWVPEDLTPPKKIAADRKRSVIEEKKEALRPAAEEVFKMVEPLLRAQGDRQAAEGLGNVKVCKIHGTPLTANGKCLMKGCKYA